MQKTILLLALLGGLLSGCNSNARTEELVDKTSTMLSNEKILTVEKRTQITTSYGTFSGRKYSRSFTYTFFINKGNIRWEGGSAEPKNILLCGDTTYLRCLKKKSVVLEPIDSVNNTSKQPYRSEISEHFQKYVDKRYFFKLLGDDYWVEIPPERYAAVKELCEEFPVPNDNELSLKD